MVAKKVSHSEEIARMNQYLDRTELPDPMACAVDAKGKRHANDGKYCENQVESEFGGPYCEALNQASEAQRIRQWMWMPEMLDYF